MINKKRLSLFTFALFLLMLFSNLNAQTDRFVQSRYIGNPGLDRDAATTCPINECQAEDGVLHFRLAQEEPLSDDDEIRFEVQTRASLNDLRYLSGEVFIAYSTDAFGENLASRCDIIDQGIFADPGQFRFKRRRAWFNEDFYYCHGYRRHKNGPARLPVLCNLRM